MRFVELAVLAAAVALGGFVGCSADEGALSTQTGSSTTTTSATTSSTTSSTTSYPGDVTLGQRCDQDEQCADDEICLPATGAFEAFAAFWGEDGAGGPAGGYCSLPCVDDADCHGADHRCLGLGPQAVCALGCTFGTPPLDALDQPLEASKCRGRDDLMCAPLSGGGAVCMPACGSDEECPAGRRCDGRVGLCVDEPRQGDDLGAACRPDDGGTSPDEDGCAGFCQVFEDPSQQVVGKLCTSRCSMGGSLDGAGNCGGPLHGICLFQLTFGEHESGLGDQGLCSNACASHGACNFGDGLACFDPGTYATLGVGYCAVATPCPLESECAADEICLQTKAGPLCVEVDPGAPTQPLFPLGAAASGGGGSGGAAGAGGSGGAAAGGGGGASSAGGGGGGGGS